MKKIGVILVLGLSLLIGLGSTLYAAKAASHIAAMQLLLLRDSHLVPDWAFFFFELSNDQPQSAGADTPIVTLAQLEKLDVHFNMDTTGSMGGEIANLKSSITDPIMIDIGNLVSDAAFGVSSYRDFPLAPFGEPGDYPFRLDQRVTTDLTAVQYAVDSYTASGGGDAPESGFEALFQIATGAGGVSWSGGSIDPFDPGETGGPIGGAGFRVDSLPVVVHISDAVSHPASDYGPVITGEHSRTQAMNGLKNINARFIGISSGGGEALSEMINLAFDTHSTVPPCAFEADGCAPGACCTGLSGTEVPSVAGECPLVFQVDSDGTGLGTNVVDAIEFLSQYLTHDVSIQVVRDETVYPEVDTACFIKAVTPLRAEGVPTCGHTPTIVNDQFVNVPLGTQLFFEVVAQNAGCVEPSSKNQLFVVYLEIVGDGATVLDVLKVAILIPPEA